MVKAPDGSLVPRGQAGAVLEDEAAVAGRALGMVTQGTVTAIDGSTIAVVADTICVHGDTPGAVAMASRLRRDLEAAGVAIKAPHR